MNNTLKPIKIMKLCLDKRVMIDISNFLYLKFDLK